MLKKEAVPALVSGGDLNRAPALWKARVPAPVPGSDKSIAAAVMDSTVVATASVFSGEISGAGVTENSTVALPTSGDGAGNEVM